MPPTLRTATLALALLAGACATVAPLRPDEGGRDIVKLDLARPDPGSVLRTHARTVDPGDPLLPALVERMRRALERTGGVGIAAPQIGASRRVAIVKLGTRPEKDTHDEVLVNPEIVETSGGMEADYEACLSIEGVGALVARYRRVRVRYRTVGGDTRELALENWDARIAQHELDHLDGVLFVDRLAGPLLPMEEARRLRNEAHRARGWLPAEP